MCVESQRKTKGLMWVDTMSDSIVICSTISELERTSLVSTLLLSG